MNLTKETVTSTAEKAREKMLRTPALVWLAAVLCTTAIVATGTATGFSPTGFTFDQPTTRERMETCAADMSAQGDSVAAPYLDELDSNACESLSDDQYDDMQAAYTYRYVTY